MQVAQSGQRILLKLSGEALKWSRSYGFDVQYLDILAKKIVSLHQQGIQLVIVLWWGNIFRGVAGEKLGMDRATGDYIGMIATIINGVALWEALERNGVEVRVTSAIEINKVAEPFIRKRVLRHLQKNRIVICAWGTGSPYHTTDSAAVNRALELDCQLLVKGTKVDGVYDKDPVIYSDAVRFDTLPIAQALQMGIGVMDHSAIALAMDEKLPLFVCNIDDIGNLSTHEMQGTLVS
jgi:uridylate kinase